MIKLEGFDQINPTNDTLEKIIANANDIREAKGMKPLESDSTIHSLADLHTRLIDLAEKHVSQLKEINQKNKEEILEISTIASNWTRRQGYSRFGSMVTSNNCVGAKT